MHRNNGKNGKKDALKGGEMGEIAFSEQKRHLWGDLTRIRTQDL
jgi:hypothetical protein